MSKKLLDTAMEKTKELQKLIDLKNKKIISEAEYEEQKTSLMKNNSDNVYTRTQFAYCFFSVFGGTFGLHHLYAKRYSAFIIQLLFFVVPIFFAFKNHERGMGVFWWAVLQLVIAGCIFAVKTDNEGKKFQPDRGAMGIFGLLQLLYTGTIIWLMIILRMV